MVNSKRPERSINHVVSVIINWGMLRVRRFKLQGYHGTLVQIEMPRLLLAADERSRVSSCWGVQVCAPVSRGVASTTPDDAAFQLFEGCVTVQLSRSKETMQTVGPVNR